MTRTIATLATVVLVALAGCGGNESKPNAGSNKSGSSGGGGGQQIALAAPEDGSLKFDKTELEGKAGTVTINFDNLSSSVPHGVGIEGNGVNEMSDTVTGAKTSVTADLKPGKYTFYCPVDSHRSQGMEGTITVK